MTTYYHYTTEEAARLILDSGVINASRERDWAPAGTYFTQIGNQLPYKIVINQKKDP